MKIGLIDVDGHHFPNFALMKLAAWHKSHGDSVEWANALFCNDYERYSHSALMNTARGTVKSLRVEPDTTSAADLNMK